MDPLIGAALVSGGFGLANSGLQGMWDLIGGGIKDKRQYKYSKKLLRMQQEFAREMASTAHQLEVADLKKAGLNPILSAGGSGAHAQVGGAPSVGGNSGSSIEGFGDPLGSAMEYVSARQSISSAKTAQKLHQEQISTEKAKQREFDSQVKANDARAVLDRAQAAEVTSGLPLNRLPGFAIKQFEKTGIINSIVDWLVGSDSGVSKTGTSKQNPAPTGRKRSAPPPTAKQQQQEYKKRYHDTHERDNHSLNRSDLEWNPVSNTYERR